MIEVESEILSSVIDCKTYHKHVPEYGHRAWKAEGKFVDVVYWDLGNGWCGIMDVILKKDGEQAIIRFYKKLKKVINASYDEKGFRLG